MIVTQESGISVDNQDSVMQIAPAEFSSASCWISSTFLGSDLTLVDSIVGIPYTLCCHSLLTLLKPPKLTDLCVNCRFSAMWLPVLTAISTVINYSWNRANSSVIPSPVVSPRSLVSRQTIAL